MYIIYLHLNISFFYCCRQSLKKLDVYIGTFSGRFLYIYMYIHVLVTSDLYKYYVCIVSCSLYKTLPLLPSQIWQQKYENYVPTCIHVVNFTVSIQQLLCELHIRIMTCQFGIKGLCSKANILFARHLNSVTVSIYYVYVHILAIATIKTCIQTKLSL